MCCSFTLILSVFTASLYLSGGLSHIEPLVVAGRVLYIKYGLSILPAFRLSGRFLGIVSLVFSKFWQDARNLYEVVRDTLNFWENNFCPKIGKMAPKWASDRVFLFLFLFFLSTHLHI